MDTRFIIPVSTEPVEVRFITGRRRRITAAALRRRQLLRHQLGNIRVRHLGQQAKPNAESAKGSKGDFRGARPRAAYYLAGIGTTDAG